MCCVINNTKDTFYESPHIQSKQYEDNDSIVDLDAKDTDNHNFHVHLVLYVRMQDGVENIITWVYLLMENRTLKGITPKAATRHALKSATLRLSSDSMGITEPVNAL